MTPPIQPVSRGKFCDYCKCSDCQSGWDLAKSLPCEDGTNICDVCYGLDPCGRGCEAQPCEHKPKLLAPCPLCGKGRTSLQVFCSAVCSARWEAGERPESAPPIDVGPGRSQ